MIIRSPEEVERFLDKHRVELEHPEVYLGREPNTYHKKWTENKFKILIASVWRYEDVRGNQTIPLLYQMINEHYGDRVICERAFFPNSEKDYKAFRKYRIPMFGLESRRSMGEYDLVLTSLSFLPPWINYPLMLRMSGISPFWHQRDVSDPLFMVGGSAMYGNFCIAYPNVDIIYLGDAEPGLFPLLESIQQGKTLTELSYLHDYVFIPSSYDPVYNGEKFVEWQTVEPDIPKKLNIIRQKKLDEAPALTKPFPSYTDPSMGLGEVELSRGCRAGCVYCGLGWKYRPYRERSREKFIEAITDNMWNSGTFKGLCPIAAEFAYYSEKRGLFNDLCKLSSVVDPLSMRVDAWAADEKFAISLAEKGMNNLAIGVEGISQRIRDWMGKGVSEEEILEACQIAIEHKVFKKIKFFLISNVGETQKDWDEFFGLLTKIRQMMTEHRWMKIKVSWTPLFVEPCTPLQWMKPTIDQRQPWKKISERLDKLKIEYPRGGGGKNEENFLFTMQGMHLGDTRFAKALSLASLEKDRPQYVGFAKDFKEVLLKYMEMLSYPLGYLMRERKADEAFPWDIVNRGVTKSGLLKVYNKIQSGQKLEFLKPKVETVVLDTSKNPDNVVGKVLGCRWLVQYNTKQYHDVVPNVHWNAQIHRAAYLKGLPIAINSLRFFSNRACRNWHSGFGYFFFGCRFPINVDQIFNMNEHLSGIEITRVSLWDSKFSFNNFYGLYHVETDVTPDQLVTFYLDFVRAHIVTVIARETRHFSGERKKEINIKFPKTFYDLEIEKCSILPALNVKVGNSVGIRYFLHGIFDSVSHKRILGYPVELSGLYFLQNNILEEVSFEYSLGDTL